MANNSSVNRLRDFAREHWVALLTAAAILLLLTAFGTWQAVRAMRAEVAASTAEQDAAASQTEAERQRSRAEKSAQEAREYAARLQASEAEAQANAKKALEAQALARESARQAKESQKQAEVMAQQVIEAKSREIAARVDALLPDAQFSKEEIGNLEEQVQAAEGIFRFVNDQLEAGKVGLVDFVPAKAGLCVAKGRLAWAKDDLLQCQKEYDGAVAAWKQYVDVFRTRLRVGTVNYSDVYAAETTEKDAELFASRVKGKIAARESRRQK